MVEQTLKLLCQEIKIYGLRGKTDKVISSFFFSFFIVYKAIFSLIKNFLNNTCRKSEFLIAVIRLL